MKLRYANGVPITDHDAELIFRGLGFDSVAHAARVFAERDRARQAHTSGAPDSLAS